MLDAALTVFADKGYDQATLEEVATLAEFGKGTLYNYFPGGKQEILFSLLERQFDEMSERTGRYFADAEARNLVGREMLRGYIFMHVAYLFERQDVFAVLMKEVHRLAFDSDPDNVRRLITMHDRMVEQIAGPVGRAIERGELREGAPHVLAHMILEQVRGHLMCLLFDAQCAEDDRHFSDYADPGRAADLIATALLDGLALSSSHDA